VASLVLFVALAVAWLVCTVAVQMRGFTVGADLALVLHERIDHALERLPRAWFRRGRAGEVSQLVGGTALSAMNIPAHLLRPLVNAVVTPVLLVIGPLVLDPWVGLAMLVASPLLALVVWTTDRSVNRADADRRRTMTQTAERLLEFARAQPVLRAFGHADQSATRLGAVLSQQEKAERRLIAGTVPGVLSYDVVSRLLYVIGVAVAAVQLSQGHLDAPEFVAVVVIGMRIAEAVSTAAGLAAGMRMNRRDLAGLNELLAVEPQQWPDQPAVPAGNAVSLCGVGYSYDGDHQVLDGIDLDLPERGLTALVGPSGAGKSTLAHLLPRFLDPTSGTVGIGGVDVRRIGRDDLAGRVAVVPQQVYLTGGTLRDNITLGRPGASDEEIGRACGLARITDLVDGLEEGLDTPVGTRGDRFSGGEKQRIALARALITGAPIVVLDEVTSSLDAGNDRAVTETLQALARESSVLVIAHRLADVVRADQIVVLAGGRIVQRGRHEDLIGADGVYRDMWRAQTSSSGWQLRSAGASA
jgi:ATP-binding cassette subfamily B protein